jgi:hypothetical protein
VRSRWTVWLRVAEAKPTNVMNKLGVGLRCPERGEHSPHSCVRQGNSAISRVGVDRGSVPAPDHRAVAGQLKSDVEIANLFSRRFLMAQDGAPRAHWRVSSTRPRWGNLGVVGCGGSVVARSPALAVARYPADAAAGRRYGSTRSRTIRRRNEACGASKPSRACGLITRGSFLARVRRVRGSPGVQSLRAKRASNIMPFSGEVFAYRGAMRKGAGLAG